MYRLVSSALYDVDDRKYIMTHMSNDRWLLSSLDNDRL